MKHASENQTKEVKHLSVKSSKKKQKIFAGIISAAVISSAIIVPTIISQKNSQTSEPNKAANEISYTDARIAQAQSLTATAKAARAMSEGVEIPIVAYSLKVDGKTIAVMSSAEDIRNALTDMKKAAVKDFKDAKAQFVEKVEVLEGMHMKSELSDVKALKSILTNKSETTSVHTVKKGESRDTIAKYYGISTDELESLNPSIKDSKIKTGDKLTIAYKKAPISVKFTVTESKTTDVKFKKETVKDSKLSSSYKKVTTEGQNGESKITSQVTYIDGREASRKIIEEEVISEPINEVTTIGINDNPTASLGKFSWPLPNYSTITSEFGPRWGTNHNGLDISGSGVYGADIVASDGGTVILSQEDNSGYGRYVIIDHGNGYKTLYGHCSELCVSVGDKVSSGQKIAEVGSTGYSTGPHLHFEIIDNDTKIDPYPFLFG